MSGSFGKFAEKTAVLAMVVVSLQFDCTRGLRKPGAEATGPVKRLGGIVISDVHQETKQLSRLCWSPGMHRRGLSFPSTCKCDNKYE